MLSQFKKKKQISYFSNDKKQGLGFQDNQSLPKNQESKPKIHQKFESILSSQLEFEKVIETQSLKTIEIPFRLSQLHEKHTRIQNRILT